jgi:hypothetical protein
MACSLKVLVGMLDRPGEREAGLDENVPVLRRNFLDKTDRAEREDELLRRFGRV